MIDDQAVRAYAYLLRAVEPPAPAVHAFVVAHGVVDAVERIRAQRAPAAVMTEVAHRAPRISPDSLDDDMRMIESGTARLITPDHEDEWPAGALAALSSEPPWTSPPLALWVHGAASLATLFDRAVSVVGARASTRDGNHLGADFGYGLANAGITVVAGAAYGIDGAAHRGALSADGITVAVLGCGIDVVYPAGHTTLLDQIVERGLVLSEYPPGTHPARHRFAVRNRLIAALGVSTVLVEAGTRSGALGTAALARRLGRPVLAVPGPIISGMSTGTNELLRTGAATAVSTVADIIESSGLSYPH